VSSPRLAPMVPAASEAEATSVAADPMRPTRTMTGREPNSGSSAMATRTTDRDGPLAATPPARKAERTSCRLIPAASAFFSPAAGAEGRADLLRTHPGRFGVLLHRGHVDERLNDDDAHHRHRQNPENRGIREADVVGGSTRRDHGRLLTSLSPESRVLSPRRR